MRVLGIIVCWVASFFIAYALQRFALPRAGLTPLTMGAWCVISTLGFACQVCRIVANGLADD